MENLPIFDQNHGLTSFGKCQYFDLINLLFLFFRKVFFLSRISWNTFFCHFFGWNKNTEILPIYDQTHCQYCQFLTKPIANLWPNPFKKILIFRLYYLVVFIVYEDVFSFWNMVKHIIPSFFWWNKKMEKLPIFDQTHKLTPLEKCQFFDLINLLFLLSRKVYSLPRISSKTFFSQFFGWNKNCQFLTKLMD